MPLKFKKNFNSYQAKIKKIPLNKISWLISLILIGWLIIFLYSDLYGPLTDIKILMTLKKQVSPEKLNMDSWNKINQQIKLKKQLININQIKRNPFE